MDHLLSKEKKQKIKNQRLATSEFIKSYIVLRDLKFLKKEIFEK